jgi:hypothetical protein
LSKSAFDVQPYDLDRFVTVVAATSSGKSAAEIKASKHLVYFNKYLDKIGAKTLVAESPYIDRDFLEDFAAYYVRCFPKYPRECTRVHFFSEEFTKDDLMACLEGRDSKVTQEFLQKSYLGFTVIKPLPQTVIGRTCLVTYAPENRRFFPTTRSFVAHLFGLKLRIDHTLPFQEQDSIVAACATSALWTVFQSTAKHFGHHVLTPIEITRAATHLLPAETRVLPNKGLSSHMMAHAIKSVGLEPYLIQVPRMYLLQSAIYAYVRSGIPLILGVELIDQVDAGNAKSIGLHALAVLGYSLGEKVRPLGPSNLRLRASRIDKIYVHDDQVGPFARMDLDDFQLSLQGAKDRESLSTSWPSAGEKGAVRAVPSLLLAPLYHKVRIDWKWVLDVITGFDQFISGLPHFEGMPKLNELEWDVFLTDVNDLKADILANKDLPAKRKAEFLTQSMPRFVWRATAYRGDKKVIDLLFDATDIDTADAIVDVIHHDASAGEFLQEIAVDPNTESLARSPGAKKLIRWLRAQKQRQGSNSA